MNSGPDSRRGLTLAEAIVSMFVLLAGVTVMVRLFHTGLRYSTLVDNQSIATVLNGNSPLAEKKVLTPSA